MLAFTFSSARRLGWSSLLGEPVHLFSVDMLPYCSLRQRRSVFFSFSNACLTCWWLDDKVGSSAEAVQYYKYYMQMFSNDLIGQCRRL